MDSTQKTYTLDDLSNLSTQLKSQQPTIPGTKTVERDVIITDTKSTAKWGGLTWLIIIFIIIALILFFFRPDLVLSTNSSGQKYLDWGKLILWSLVFALIIVLVLWFARDSHGML